MSVGGYVGEGTVFGGNEVVQYQVLSQVLAMTIQIDEPEVILGETLCRVGDLDLMGIAWPILDPVP